MAVPNKVTAMPCQDFSQQILSHPGTLSIKMPEMTASPIRYRVAATTG